jgi:hypothetical protein
MLDSQLEALWWQGIEQWYNDQNYAEAMQLWETALDATSYADQSLESILQLDNANSQHTNNTKAAPLWLFLAGCYLDAGQYENARRSLRVCIRDCCTAYKDDGASNSNSQGVVVGLLQRALVEYMASYDESNTTTTHKSRRILELVRDSRVASQLVDSNFYKDPYFRPGFMYPNVSTQPHYADQERPAWCSNVLEANFSMIRNEFATLCAHHTEHFYAVGGGSHRGGAGQHDARVVSKGGDWKEVVLFAAHGKQCHLVPQTSRLIQRYIPDAVALARSGGGEVIFSILAPRTTIHAHCATTNLRLTAHLGISIPDDTSKCRIRVADKWHNWQVGKVLVFDDAYEHQVENNTDSTRVVLLLRFWHPNLPVQERQGAIEHAARDKEWDRVRRYNPPLPTTKHAVVTDRAMEQSVCDQCARTGYESLRVRPRSFEERMVCVCGAEIR